MTENSQSNPPKASAPFPTQTGSVAASAHPTSTFPKKRSPIERTIVWGVIAIMLILVGIQGNAWRGFNATLTELRTAVKGTDEVDGNRVFEHTMKEKILKGGPSGAERLKPELSAKDQARGVGKIVTYSWKGPFKNYVIIVNYGVAGRGENQDSEVLDYKTGDVTDDKP